MLRRKEENAGRQVPENAACAHLALLLRSRQLAWLPPSVGPLAALECEPHKHLILRRRYRRLSPAARGECVRAISGSSKRR